MVKFPERQAVSLQPIGMESKNVLGSFVQGIKPIVQATGQALDFLQEEEDKILLNLYKNEMTRRVHEDYINLRENNKGLYSKNIIESKLLEDAINNEHRSFFERTEKTTDILPERLKEKCALYKDGLYTSYFSQATNYIATEMNTAKESNFNETVKTLSQIIADNDNYQTVKIHSDNLKETVKNYYLPYGEDYAEAMAKNDSKIALLNQISTTAQKDARKAIILWNEQKNGLYKDFTDEERFKATQLLRASIENTLAQDLAISIVNKTPSISNLDFLAQTGLYDESSTGESSLLLAQKRVRKKAEDSAITIGSLQQEKIKEENKDFLTVFNNLPVEQQNEIFATKSINGRNLTPSEEELIFVYSSINNNLAVEEKTYQSYKEGKSLNGNEITTEAQRKFLSNYSKKEEAGLNLLSMVQAGFFGDPADVIKSKEFQETTYKVKNQIMNAMYNAVSINRRFEQAKVDFNSLLNKVKESYKNSIDTSIDIHRNELQSAVYAYLAKEQNLEMFLKQDNKEVAMANVVRNAIPSLYESSPKTKEIASLYEKAYLDWNNLSKNEKAEKDFLLYLQDYLNKIYSSEDVENILQDVYNRNFYKASDFLLGREESFWSGFYEKSRSSF